MSVVGNGQRVKGALERRREAGSAITRAVLLLLIVVVVALSVVWGISSRRKANAQLEQETQELSVPVVAVIHPKPGSPQQEFALPGDMQQTTRSRLKP